MKSLALSFLLSFLALLAGAGHGPAAATEIGRRKADQVTAAAISDVVDRNSFQDLSGRPFKISPDAPMWNSGVLGLHSSDAHLLEEALNLIDQMWPKVQDAPLPVHHVEQFASGYFLERTRISESHDIVYHYWPEYLRVPFRRRHGTRRYSGQ